MPELPEVQTIVTHLHRAVAGARIASVNVLRRDIIRRGARQMAAALKGARIDTVQREGKRIVIHTNRSSRLVVHLGMSGRLLVLPKNAAVEKHTHLRIRLIAKADEIRFVDPRRFGGVWFLDDSAAASNPSEPLRPLGPDALNIRAATLRQVCTRRRQIKALLLDQQAISGLGNIYCDESLFAARIHPLAKASDLDPHRVRSLATEIRRTLRAAVRAGGSTLRDYRSADGTPGFFQMRHRVYGRAGKPCTRCRAPIMTTQVASRTTHFCEACQQAEIA